MKSIARRVAASGTIILALTLLVLGLSTAIVLHKRQQFLLDEALLAAAYGRAHPDPEDDFEIDDIRSPIEVWIVDSEDHRIPQKLVHRAIEKKGPLYITVSDERIVLLSFELEREVNHERRVKIAAASAPRLTVTRSVGLLGLIYGILSILALGLASILQFAAVKRAFRPVDRAREQAGKVTGFGTNQRLDEDAPAEIRPMLVAINSLLERLERSYEAQTRFTAEAAHELRTPVTTMLGELDVALRNPRSPEEYQRILVSAREDVLRLRQLVEGLTQLARLDTGNIVQSRELMRAGEVANHALASEAANLKMANIQVKFDLHDDPEITVHRALFEAAIANLLRNVARHAPGSTMEFKVDSDSKFANFTIDDSGLGIAEEHVETVFDRFVRGSHARVNDRQGLGLGLAITREVARRHGGDCVLEKSHLGGLRVRLFIPIQTLSDI